MKKIILSLLLAATCAAQTPTKIRTMTSLPATCQGGSPTQASDMVQLVSGGLYMCSGSNSWRLTVDASSFYVNNSNLGQGLYSEANGQQISFTGRVNVTAATPGADWCAKIATAAGRLPSNGNGVIDASGLGVANISPACSATNAHALGAALNSGVVILPPGTLYLPMSSATAAVACQAPHATSFCTPRGGVIQLGNKFTGFVGQGRGDIGTGIGTTFSFCTGLNTPVPGCTAPETTTYAISSTTVTHAGGRTYLGFVVSGIDIAPGEPFRVFGSTSTNQDGPFRVCSPDNLNSTRNDASCPADPIASLVYAPVSSGVTGLTFSGSGTGYTTTCTFSGGGGSGATCSATVSSGNVTGITITNPGVGYTSAPTIAVSGGTGQTFTAQIITACSSSCGTFAKELPMFDLTPLQQPGAAAVNNYAQNLINMALDGGNLNGASGIRSTTGNEHSGGRTLKFARFPERAISVYTFHAQNGDTYQSIEILSGGGTGCTNCTVGTVGAFFSEIGPHGMNDWTINFGSSAHTHMACLVMDTQTDPVLISNGHCENGQNVVLMGYDAPTQGVVLLAVAGGPSGNCADTNCVPTDGPYQNGQSSVVTVVPHYITGSPFTRDYLFLGLMRVNQINVMQDWVNGQISNNNTEMLYGADANNGGVVAYLSSDPNLTSLLPNLNVTGTVTAATLATTGTDGSLLAILRIQSSTSGNTDLAGELTNSGGTSSYTFVHSYATHPICTANQGSNTTDTVKLGYSGFPGLGTVTFTTTGASDVVDYQCVGRN